ncbi:hypothetical protein OEZ86_002749 [Tetradesmus obliquus]|nr:hypothetical protein OEZ86_002749 [Tetradesmus obliquus]
MHLDTAVSAARVFVKQWSCAGQSLGFLLQYSKKLSTVTTNLLQAVQGVWSLSNSYRPPDSLLRQLQRYAWLPMLCEAVMCLKDCCSSQLMAGSSDHAAAEAMQHADTAILALGSLLLAICRWCNLSQLLHTAEQQGAPRSAAAFRELFQQAWCHAAVFLLANYTAVLVALLRQDVQQQQQQQQLLPPVRRLMEMPTLLLQVEDGLSTAAASSQQQQQTGQQQPQQQLLQQTTGLREQHSLQLLQLAEAYLRCQHLSRVHLAVGGMALHMMEQATAWLNIITVWQGRSSEANCSSQLSAADIARQLDAALSQGSSVKVAAQLFTEALSSITSSSDADTPPSQLPAAAAAAAAAVAAAAAAAASLMQAPAVKMKLCPA